MALQIDMHGDRNRGMNDAVPGDLDTATNECDSVLLLQSAKVMFEPRNLARLFAAMNSGVPIVPAVLLKSKDEHDVLMYDFVTAKPM